MIQISEFIMDFRYNGQAIFTTITVCSLNLLNFVYLIKSLIMYLFLIRIKRKIIKIPILKYLLN